MADVSTIPLLALIQERGLVDDLQLEEVAQEHTRSGKPVIQILQDFGLLDLETVLQLMADHLGTEVVGADPAQIEKAINKFYGEESESVSDILKELGADADIAREVAEVTTGDGVTDLENLANETPIIKFVNLVLYQAVQDRASDIHFEPFEDEFKIRYRVDGALYEMTPPPKHLALPVTSRIKVMANLDIARCLGGGVISYK